MHNYHAQCEGDRVHQTVLGCRGESVNSIMKLLLIRNETIRLIFNLNDWSQGAMIGVQRCKQQGSESGLESGGGC